MGPLPNTAVSIENIILHVQGIRNDAKRVVLLDSAPADPRQQALLHSSLEAQDGDLVGRL